jgi:signal transduction histidine kinase
MSRRIVICLGLLLGLCLVGDAIALACLRSSIAQVTSIAESHRIQTLRTALSSGGVRIERDLLAAANGLNADSGDCEEDLRRFEEALEDCMTCHHEPAVQAGLDRLQNTFGDYRSEYLQLVSSGSAAEGPSAEQTRSLAGSVVRQASVMADQAATHLTIRSRAAEARVRQAWIVLIGSMAATLVFGGLIAFHLKRRITAPLDSLLQGTDRIRQGDIDYRFEVDGDEEFRKLGMAFNQANESLQNVQEGVIQAEKMAAIGKLAAGIAHEVNNPLASISSVAQMMRRKSDGQQQSEQIDLIMQNIGRVSRIVRELLTFARPANGNTEGAVDVGAVLDHAVSLLRYDKRARNMQIAQDYNGELHIARGDADRLLLVFTNIMINAFDAMASCRNGDARLGIVASRTEDRVVIRFADNGAGMSPEQVCNAFEPFYTTKAPGAGTGLGLWICYQVVRRHDGDVHIESQVGKGTIVTVSLPLA